MHTNLLSTQQIYAGDSKKMEHLIFPSSGLTMVLLKKSLHYLPCAKGDSVFDM